MTRLLTPCRPDRAGTACRPRRAGSGNPFAPQISVNGLGITGFEIEQRMRFMQLMRQTGDLRAGVDGPDRGSPARLGGGQPRHQDHRGATAGGDGRICRSRANLPLEEFLKALGQAGVEPQTFRDFVNAGMLWREVIRSKYSDRIRISEADIDRALLLEWGAGQGTRVLLSEVIIPRPRRARRPRRWPRRAASRG